MKKNRGAIGISVSACIYAFILATSFLIPVGAFAKDADTPAMDPNAELTDQKLNPAVGKILSDAIVSYNAREYRDAEKKIDDARAIPSLTPYDKFQIENLNGTVEHARGDDDGALLSYEAMASNPAAPQSNRAAIYASCITLNTHEKHYLRAIQYGRLLERMHLLNAEASANFAKAYYAAGLFADAERTAQAAIGAGVTDAKTNEKLQELVHDSQEKMGERAQDTGEQVARGLFGAILGGVATGLTGQVVTPDMGIRTQDQAKAEAPTYAAQAGQQAAAESIATDPSLERVVYADFFATEVSPKEKKRAQAYFNAASDFYGKNNYAAAAGNLRKTLDIDPTNSAANYYYADCLARQNGDPIDVVDYLTRAVVFGAGDENATMAKTALQGLATPSAG
jgi:tetratricopeptide (TPR) repeat protein